MKRLQLCSLGLVLSFAVTGMAFDQGFSQILRWWKPDHYDNSHLDGVTISGKVWIYARDTEATTPSRVFVCTSRKDIVLDTTSSGAFLDSETYAAADFDEHTAPGTLNDNWEYCSVINKEGEDYYCGPCNGTSKLVFVQFEPVVLSSPATQTGTASLVLTFLETTYQNASLYHILELDPKSYTTSLTYDCNNDGQVNEFDLWTVQQNYGTAVTGGRSDGDFNGDGHCNFTDVVNLLGSSEWQPMRRTGVALPF